MPRPKSNPYGGCCVRKYLNQALRTAPVRSRTGRTKKGYFWVLARDDRSWRGRAPPAVVYSYAPGRSGENVAALLQGYTGMLQKDGYAAHRSSPMPGRRRARS
jgi:hypothetical protein